MLNSTAIDTARDDDDTKDEPLGEMTLQIRFMAIEGRERFDDPAVLRSMASGNAKLYIAAAVQMRQIRDGNDGVLPVADMFWYSPRYFETNGFLGQRQSNEYLT